MKQVFTFKASDAIDRCDYHIEAVEVLHRFDALKNAIWTTELSDEQAFMVYEMSKRIGKFDYIEEELYLNEGAIECVLLDSYFEAFKAELARDLSFEVPDDFEFDAEFEVFESIEDGWTVQKSSVEAPSGYAWIYKPSSFNPYEPSTYALVKKPSTRKYVVDFIGSAWIECDGDPYAYVEDNWDSLVDKARMNFADTEPMINEVM